MTTFSITCIDALDYTPTIKALESTLDVMQGLGVCKVYWFSDIDIPKKVNCDVQWIKIPRFKRYTDEYNYITLKLVPYISTEDYNIIIHADGYAINRDAWDEEFLNYDYIGAVWPWLGNLVGNGGFCMRSRKLYDAIIDLDIKPRTSDYPTNIINNSENHVLDAYGDKVIPEDNIICKIHKGILEKEYGIKFAPAKIADKFSIEHNMSSNWIGKSFGFHGKHGVANHYGVKL